MNKKEGGLYSPPSKGVWYCRLIGNPDISEWLLPEDQDDDMAMDLV